MNVADTIFSNGAVLTQEPDAPVAEALAVRGDRIVAVGARNDVEALAGPKTRRVDLEGGALLPGFNDAHVHVWKVGQLLTSILDLRGVSGLEELAARLRERDRELPEGAWLLGRGYNEALMAEGRQPDRETDAACPDRPVALTRTCGHMMVVNTRALRLAGVDRHTSPPAGGAIVHDARGEPTGLLQETAMGFAKQVIPGPSVEEYRAMLCAAHAAQLGKGITSATEAGAYVGLVAAYRALDADGELRVRSNVMAMRLADESVEPLPLPEVYVSEALRVDSVKLFADGGLSGATAALLRPYRHQDTRGLIRADADELYEMARQASENGLRVCTHAIGDAAIESVLDAYERLGRPGSRIEHFGLPSPAQLARARRLGVMAAPQTIFIHSLGANFRRYLTDDYLERCYPVRSMLESGIVVALSSDAPVVPDDAPLLGIEAAVTRRDLEGQLIAPSESIGVRDALYAYTMGGALASGDGSNRGSLAAGKWADLVLLDWNPEESEPQSLHEIQVRSTYVGGELAHSA